MPSPAERWHCKLCQRTFTVPRHTDPALGMTAHLYGKHRCSETRDSLSSAAQSLQCVLVDQHNEPHAFEVTL
jgi:hypothetical protein